MEKESRGLQTGKALIPVAVVVLLAAVAAFSASVVYILVGSQRTACADEPKPGQAGDPHPHPHPHPPAQPPKGTKPPKKIVKDISMIGAYTFDPSKGEKGSISYTLLEPARVRIVITEKDDPDQLYRVLFWEWQEKGRRVIRWDGKDQSGYVLELKRCAVSMRFDPKSMYRPGTKEIKPLTTAQLAAGHQGGHNHNLCDAKKCKPAKVTITEAVPQTKAGSPGKALKVSPGMTLSGVVLLKAEAAKDCRGYSDKTGYGVRWMLGHKIIADQYWERETDGKFAFRLDTTAYPDGEHILRVSCCDHYDHTGVVSVKVRLRNE